MIEVRNLTKKYGKNTAVDNISFSVEKGTVLGFLGPNGAGKTTTMNILTGCLSATEGEVEIDGIDMFTSPKAAKTHIGYLPELPPLYQDMTPFEYLRFVGEAKGISKDLLFDEINAVMEMTGITDVSNRLIANLSKGYCQRVGIAQAMLGNPDLIILDEPTVGLDPRQITEIRRLIKDLSREHTVVISSHILSEISEICDRVIIISKGRILADDTLDGLYENNTSDSTVGLLAKCDADQMASVLSSVGVENPVISDENGLCRASFAIEKDKDLRAEIYNSFVSAKITLLEHYVTRPTLEDIFLSLTEAALDNDGDESTVFTEPTADDTNNEKESTVFTEPTVNGADESGEDNQ